MKRALSEQAIAEIEARANEPQPGTYAALLQRGDYPILNSSTSEHSGVDAVDTMRSTLERVRDEGDEQMVRMCEQWLATYAIPESELIQ